MAKKARGEMTPEEQRELQYQQIAKDLEFIPEPTYSFEIGDSVHVGALRDVVIHGIFEGGKIYEVDYTSIDNNYGRPITHLHQRIFFTWLSLRPVVEAKESFAVKDDIHFRYLQQDIGSLLHNIYFFGVDFDVDYQRGYVWTQEDKISLIDSIFNHIEIGKFVFILKKTNTSKFMYEIFDGKQRLSALKEFYENRFPYRGKFFNELSPRDQDYFSGYAVSVAEAEYLTREQKLKYFLRLNKSGKVMSQDDLKRVESLLGDDPNLETQIYQKEERAPYSRKLYRLLVDKEERYASLNENDVLAVKDSLAGILQSQYLVILENDEVIDVGIIDSIEEVVEE